MKSSLQYRREIDGLRAVAVIPVILFHAGFSVFGGGFVGVDVFFVISGYLISSILIEDLERGRFSIAQFYERRVRRIFPALAVMVLVCVPFAWIWMFPSDIKDFSRSLVAVSVFASNILFWRESGYFDTEGELKPLLHTWSLSVEEQYYVLFPLVLLLAWQFGRQRIVLAVVGVAFVSLAAAHWGTASYPDAMFYLLPSRAWELAIGALAAFYLTAANRPSHPIMAQQALSLAGLTLIGCSVFGFDKTTPFPSLYALAPTVGAVLIILFAVPTTYVGRVLGSRVFVGVGLMSYSVYLWHQPVLVFARQRSLEKLGVGVTFLLLGLTFAIAYVSWRFVERPFRDRARVKRRTLLVLAFFVTILVASIGALGYAFDGVMPGYVDSSMAKSLEDRFRFNYGLNSRCNGKFDDLPECRTSETPEIIVWGDSYAMHLVRGFQASNADVRLVQATVAMCGPLLGAAPINRDHPREWSQRCLENNDRVLAYMARTNSLRYVVLGSLFEQYANPEWELLLSDGSIVASRERGAEYLRQTIRMVRALGLKPVIFALTPQDGRNVGRCLRKAVKFEYDFDLCNISLPRSRQKQAAIVDLLHDMEAEATVVWFDRELCVRDSCRAYDGWNFIYRDQGHFSYEGSEIMGRRMGFYDLVRQAEVANQGRR